MAWPQDVTKADLEVTYYRGSGAGGQRRNKVSTAVRMLHTPTGTVTQAEEHAKQGQNKKAAWERMTDILVPLMKEAAQTQMESPTSDERVRTYHEPESRVKDHRTGKVYRYQDIMDGKLDEMITDVQAAKAAERSNR